MKHDLQIEKTNGSQARLGKKISEKNLEKKSESQTYVMKSNKDIRNSSDIIAAIPYKIFGWLGYIFRVDINICTKKETFTGEETFSEMGG